MAYTTINKHTDYFNTLLYSGTGSARTVSGVGFQPDMFWIKQRSSNQGHLVWDVVRGGNYYIPTSGTAQSNADIGTFTTASDGYSLATDAAYNGSGHTYVGWNWKAGGGQGSSNTDGSINTTYTSVNTTAGISISQWTGDGSSSATVGHGLGVTPNLIISKAISASPPEGGWFVMHSGIGDGENVRLNQTHGQFSTSQFSSGLIKESAATNQVWGFQAGSGANNGVDNVNASGHTYITYCFANKVGYSKFGTYIGNGNSNGTFVYTGFAPSLVIYKGFLGSNSTDNWEMADNKRSPHNPVTNVLYPNLQNAEGTGVTTRMDLLSNGFRMRTNGTDYNGNGQSYIYMAWGQSLVGSNNVPCTAR